MSNAALYLATTGHQATRQAAAMLALCEAAGWRIVGLSSSTRAVAALVATGLVEIVVSIRWEPALARAVEAAGGRLETVRRRPPARGADFAAAVNALAEAGKLDDGEVASLLAAASRLPESGPDRGRHPRRAA